MPITTDLDKFRLELGDVNESAPLLNDDEANYFIAKHPANLLLAVADACDALATRFAREFDFDADGEKSFKRSQKVKAYRDQAARLRQRALSEPDANGDGGIPLGVFPAPHDWQNDLAGNTTTIDPMNGWPL